MKNLTRIFVIFVLTIITTVANSQDTAVVTLTPPDTIGACLDNSFSMQFHVTDTQRLSIHTFLNFNGTPYSSCNSSALTPVFIVVDSANLTYLFDQTVFDTVGTTWTATIVDTGTITLWYHIYIDCSVISSSPSNINLVQSLTDSSGNFIYHIFPTSSDTIQSSNLISPIIEDVTDDPFFVSYLNLNYLVFKYRNNGLVPANIKFRFNPDSTDYNGQLPIVNLEYAEGYGSSYASLNADSLTEAFIPSHDTLYIRQQVQNTACLDTLTVNALFTWQCNNPPADSGIFCTQCSDVNNKDYSVWNGNNPVVRVTRVTPPDSIVRWDHSCVNDSAGMLQWEYRITNAGLGALDSIHVKLLKPDAIPYLTLIPLSSLFIDTICNNCSATIDIDTATLALCDTFYNVNDLLGSVEITARNFRETDTIIVRFRTFRCGEEAPALLNNLKYFNQWSLPVSAIDICNITADLTAPQFTYFGSRGISSNSNNGNEDLHQRLLFTPAVSDLSISPGNTFGQSAVMEMDLLGIFNTPLYDNQLLGISPQNPDTMHGYMRAVVHCETGLRIENPATDVRLKLFNSSLGSYVYHNPVYYNTVVPDSICQGGDYYFYFNLADSAMLSFLNAGFFEFKLQACCGGADPTTDYDIKFYIMPNPSSCLTLSFADTTHLNPPPCTGLGCAWIPLSSDGNFINVHCPGCKKPGMIVDNYYMRRTTFGLQDSNNDGRADSLSAQIIPGSTWFNNNESVLKLRQSSFGDELEDFLTAHFQEGDPTGANDTVKGYTYQQMVAAGAFLNYLQLDRTISAGLDTLKVLPLEFTLYIDTPDVVNPNCINCNGYEVDTAQFRTQHILNVSGVDVSNFIDTISANNRYFFTFDTHDSLGVLSGNLHDSLSFTDISSFIFTDTLSPLTGFFEGQQYRLHTRYSECGTFSGGSSPTLSTVKKVSEISNKMWMSGQELPHTAYSTVNFAPNTILELHQDNWTFDTLLCDTCDLINHTFANEHYFLCETYGGFHFFFSQDYNNGSSVVNDSACNKLMNATFTSQIAANLVNVYPNEYRPPSFDAAQYRIAVPDGYHIIQSRVHNIFKVNNSTRYSNWHYFTAPFDTGTFILYDTILPYPSCMPDSLSFSPTGFPLYASDTLQYLGSRSTQRLVEFKLAPNSCDTIAVYPTDSSVIISFDLADIACINNAGCSLDTIKSINMFVSGFTPPLVNHPNFAVQYDPSITADHHRICDTLELSNLPTTFSGYPSTAAGNVFIAVPSVSFLSNWAFFTATDTLFPTGNIIQVTPSLGPNFPNKISGNLCADYITCHPDTTINVYAGWNCEGFPSSPFSPDSVCGYDTLSIAINNAEVGITTIGKEHPLYYNLCEPFEITITYQSNFSGAIYPLNIELDTLIPGLQPLYALIYNCNESLHDTLSIGIDSTSWNITGANMAAIGHPDSALSAGCINFHIWFMPQCSFANQETLPGVIMNSRNYCDSLYISPANYEPPFISQDSSICTDCFTVTKTVDPDTVIAGIDTVTFTITICGNNYDTLDVYITDLLPQAFDTISLSFNNPSFVSIPAQGCATLTATGFFNTPGSCSDSSHTNIVQVLTPSFTTLSDSACVTVLEFCADTSVTNIQIDDSSFSSTYGSSLTGDSIFIEGRFYIDQDFKFINCKVYTAAGAQIIVLPGVMLVIDSTDISGCTHMWRGIMLQGENLYYEVNHSKLRDADTAVYVNHGCYFYVENSDVSECIIGIYTPPDTSYHSIYGVVTGSRFGMWNGSLKPDYTGQPYHGLTPKTGMELNNMVLTIGDNSLNRNQFNRMNIGITGIASALDITNSEFMQLLEDTAYNVAYGGTAVVSVRNQLATPTAYLTFNPVIGGDTTVISCKRGVYTLTSGASIYNIFMTGVETGVYSTKCGDHLTTDVIGCTIYANHYGIDFINNSSTGGMNASYNSIYMDGSGTFGISMYETAIYANTPYAATCNYVELIDGNTGIFCNYLKRVGVNKNIVEFSSADTTLAMHGIRINSCIQASIGYNNVKSNTVAAPDTTKIGVAISISDNSNISCNTVDSTGWGFFFGGSCLGTNFRGNLMNEHYDGLRLNNVAVADTQTNAGNRWLGTYGSGFGAVNMNWIPIFNLVKSLFEVNPLAGASYTPIFPTNIIQTPYFIDNSGWFQPVSGTTYSCSSPIPCYDVDFTGDGGSEDLRMLIAEDSSLSAEYIPETKNMAKMQLYEELQDASSAYANDSLLLEFKTESDSNAIGQLYQVHEKLNAVSTFDSLSLTLIHQTDSLFSLTIENIKMLDSIAAADTSTDYSIQRDSLINELNILQQTRADLIAEHHLQAQAEVANAITLNDAITPVELPEENDQIINDVSARYYLYGIGNISSDYSQILSIASQCPYAGGKAVYRARGFVKLFNNSILYDDANVCLQAGIFREAEKQNSLENKWIKIIPNPANESLELILTGKYEGICRVILKNAIIEEIYNSSFDCKQKHTKINTSNFAPGVYYIQLYVNNEPVQFEKLIIVR